MGKLTNRQMEFLKEAYANRRNYGHGTGAKVFDKHDQRVANNLERMGLIMQPVAYTRLLGAHLTAKGLDAVAQLQSEAE